MRINLLLALAATSFACAASSGGGVADAGLSDGGATDAGDQTVDAGPQPPAITSFSPVKAEAGATVTLVGTGFGTTPSSQVVTFLGADGAEDDRAAVVTSATETRLEVTVPDGVVEGPLSVVVGGLSATSAASFAVGVPFSINPYDQPVQVSQAGGFGVRFSGSGLSNDVRSYVVHATPVFGGAAVALTVTRIAFGTGTENVMQVEAPTARGLYRVSATFGNETATAAVPIAVHDWAYVSDTYNGEAYNAPLDKASTTQYLRVHFGPEERAESTYTLELLDPDTGALRHSISPPRGYSSSESGVFALDFHQYTGPVGSFRVRIKLVRPDAPTVTLETPPSAKLLTVIDSGT